MKPHGNMWSITDKIPNFKFQIFKFQTLWGPSLKFEFMYFAIYLEIWFLSFVTLPQLTTYFLPSPRR